MPSQSQLNWVYINDTKTQHTSTQNKFISVLISHGYNSFIYTAINSFNLIMYTFSSQTQDEVTKAGYCLFAFKEGCVNEFHLVRTNFRLETMKSHICC